MITCKDFAQRIKNDVKKQVDKMALKPSLVIVTVGDDPASASYVKGKIKDCKEVGIIPRHIKLPEDISQMDLNRTLRSIDDCAGIILQLPIPKHLDADQAIKNIDLCKDVDGLRQGSIYTPCTALGIFEWLKANTELTGKNVVIINRSNLVGRPLAKLLLDADATVTVCHSKTKNLDTHLLHADIVVTAVGKPNFLKWIDVRGGAIVVDVGINRVDGKLCGDYTPDKDLDKLFAITATPVPGGVGLLTRAFLLKNVVEAGERWQNIM